MTGFRASAVAEKQGDADALVAMGATGTPVGASCETPPPQADTDTTAAAQNKAHSNVFIIFPSSKPVLTKAHVQFTHASKLSAMMRAADRRAQIIAATIATLAELGYDRTSFAAIVARGGLSSTRMISYHFDDRAELMSEVAASVIAELGCAVAPRVRAAANPAAAVEAYIEANVLHMNTHRAEMIALATLLIAGALHVSPGARDSGIEALVTIIETGCRTGELRASDPRVAAMIIQQTVEAVPHLLRHQPDVDLVVHCREVASFFQTALAPPSERQHPR